MARGGFDRGKAAKVIADALTLGHKEAASRWNIDVKTVGRYVKRLEDGADTKLSELVLLEGRKAEAVVGQRRRRSMQVVEDKMIALCEQAGLGNFADVVEAYKALRDTELTAKVLNVGPGPDPESTEPPEAPGESGEGASAEARAH